VSRLKYLALTARRMSADEANGSGSSMSGRAQPVVATARRLADDICRMAPVSVSYRQSVDAGHGEGWPGRWKAGRCLAASTQDARRAGQLS
jgi:hypothetical protein